MRLPWRAAGREGLPARGVSLQYERDAFAGLRDEQGAAGRRAGRGLPRSDHSVCAPVLTADHVVIDGLFGSGLNKALSGGFAAVVKYINASPATVVSIDIPSGLMGEDNTYNVHTNIVRAHLTLSLQLPKLAFLFAENEPYVGEWQLLDIGLSEDAIHDMETDFRLLEHEDVSALA